MIEVTLKVSPNVVRETLNRIGVKVRPPEESGNTRTFEKALVPSVYLYHTKIGEEIKFFLIHFKEYFLLTQRNAYDNVSNDDRDRLAFVAKLLLDWDMIDCDKTQTIETLPNGNLTVIKKLDAPNWFIAHKIKY